MYCDYFGTYIFTNNQRENIQKLKMVPSSHLEKSIYEKSNFLRNMSGEFNANFLNSPVTATKQLLLSTHYVLSVTMTTSLHTKKNYNFYQCALTTVICVTLEINTNG
jgi:hypothetical protein